MWKQFCNEFNLRELGDDVALESNNERVKQRQRILPVVEQLFLSLTTTELTKRLESAGIPFARINAPSDLFEDEHLVSNGGLLEVTLADGENQGQMTNLPALPLELAGARFGLRQDIPRQGQHADQLLQDLGYDTDEIKSFKESGVVE